MQHGGPCAAQARRAPGEAGAMLLPVLVVDETLLLPHMSIPSRSRTRRRRWCSTAPPAMRAAPRPGADRAAGLAGRREPADGRCRTDDCANCATLLADVDRRARARPSTPAAEARRPDAEEWVPDEASPSTQEYELCAVGVIAEVGQRISRPGGQPTSSCRAWPAASSTDLVQQEPYLVARVIRHDDPVDATAEAEAAMTAVLEQVESYISMLPNVPEEVLTMVRSVEEPGWLADLIAFSPEFTADQRQELLEMLDPIDAPAPPQRDDPEAAQRAQPAPADPVRGAGRDGQAAARVLPARAAAGDPEGAGRGHAPRRRSPTSCARRSKPPGCRRRSRPRRWSRSSGWSSSTPSRPRSASSAPTSSG